MSTLLSHSSQPLWVWIVVIAIGSLSIIIAAALGTWYFIVRRRAKSETELISDEPAEKRLTLRRGRIVPATSYLSLTGSRFGITSFDPENRTQTPSVRSKSPFEWWANLRAQPSRLSHVSHVSSANYESRTGSFYQRPEMSTSKLSLTSKDENVRATVTEVNVAKPEPVQTAFKRGSLYVEPVNFSRSFTHQTQRSLATTRDRTLSRIEELTPRQSVFSAASFKARVGSYTASENGKTGDHPNSKRSSGASFLKIPLPINHSRKTSAASSSEALQHYPPQQHHQPSLAQLSVSISSTPYLSSSPTTPTFPLPPSGPYDPSASRNSLWESSMKQFPWLEDHQFPQTGRHDQPPTFIDPLASHPTFANFVQPSELVSQSQPKTQTPPVIHVHTASKDYDATLVRPEVSLPLTEPKSELFSGPLRTRSKKGNVLRKKSLERNRMLVDYV